MTKHSLSAPLLIGIAGAIDETTRDLLTELDALLPATPIFLLKCDGSDKVTAWAFGTVEDVSASEIHESKDFTSPNAAGASIDQQRAAYLLKNCTFVFCDKSEQLSLHVALDAYRHALPLWTPAATDAPPFGTADEAFALPSPAPVLDGEWLATLVKMAGQSGIATDGKAGHRARMFAQARQVVSGKKPVRLGDQEQQRQVSVRERSAFLSLPGQLRQLDAFNAELDSLETARQLGTTPTVSMSLIMEAADKCAQEHQNAWQNLVYTTTKRLANMGVGNEGRETEEEEAETTAAIEEDLGRVRHVSLLAEMDRKTRDDGARWQSLAMLGALAATMFAAFTELAGAFDNHFWHRYGGLGLLAVYLLVLGRAFWRYCDAKVEQHERKHQDYRLIAECLRVQQCWNNCGIRHYVADALPSEAASESTWVSKAIRAIGWRHSGEAGSWSHAAGIAERAEFVAVQLDYHNKTLVQRREKALELLNRRAKICLALFLLGIGGLLLNSISEACFEYGAPSLAHHLWIVATVAAISLWAAHKKVAETFGLEAEVVRGKAVRNALARAHATLASCLPGQEASARQLEDARQTLLRIGRIFVQDQAVWHALHRSRPIEIVTGG